MKPVIKMKGAMLLVLLVAMAVKGAAQDTTSLAGVVTLKQCIDIAIKNNLAINESDYVTRNNKVYVQQALGNMLPYISGNVSQTQSQGRAISSFTNTYVNQSLSLGNYGLNGTEYIWNAGAIRNNLAANKLNYQASKMDLQQQKDLITINVILGYLQILSTKEQLNAAIQQLETTREQLIRYQIQDSSGSLSNPQTLTDLRGSYASGEINIISLQNALESAKITLVQYLNLPYSSFELQQFDVEAPVLYDAPADLIFQQALQNLSVIKSAHLKTLGAIKSFKAARGQLWPTITLNGGLATNYSSAATDATGAKTPYGQQLTNNFNNYISLGLSIPILQGLVAKSRLDLARITEKRTSFEEVSAKTTLQQNVKQAFINMQTSFDKYQKNVEEVKAYQESFRIAQARLDAGNYTSLEYITAKNNLDQANINLIAVKYDYIVRTKILDYYQGKLSLQ
jgi:outer membrane protein